MSMIAPSPRPVWGLCGVIAGLIAVALVTISLSAVFEKSKPTVATQIGEMAAEIRKAATRSMLGVEQPEPETPAMTVATLVTIAIPVLAALAAISGAIGLFRREPKTLPLLAMGFGTSAFVMQYLFLMALMIGGVFILVAIINNIDGILGG